MEPVAMDPMVDGKEIVGFPAYRVTPDGQVWTCWKRANTSGNGRGYVMGSIWKSMKLGSIKSGHKHIGLNNGDGKGQVPKLVHRLVLEAFVGLCPEGMQCRHLDGDPTNNNVSNLKWGTAQENQDDREVHGTDCRGVKHPMARLTEDDVRQIKIDYYENGLSQMEIGRRRGLAQGHVSNIVLGKVWSHLKEEEVVYVTS